VLEIKALLLAKGLSKNDNRTIEHLAHGIAGLFGPVVSRSGARAAVAVRASTAKASFIVRNVMGFLLQASKTRRF